jgi:hypothetical protein
MGNYTGTARTNYFKVKDMAAFLEEIEELGKSFIFSTRDYRDNPEQGDEIAMISSEESGEWPSNRDDEGSGEEVEIDWVDLFSRHLEEGQVVVVQEVGSEKACYLNGYSWAITWDGREIAVNINEIYERIATLVGEDIEVSRAEY